MNPTFSETEVEREERLREVAESGRLFERPWNPKGIDEERLVALWTEIVYGQETIGGFRPRPNLELLDYALALYLRSAVVTAEACLHLAVSGISEASRPLERRLWETVIDVGYLLLLDSEEAQTSGAATSLAWSFLEWERHHELAQETAAARPVYDASTPGETPEAIRDRVCAALDREGIATAPVCEAFNRLERRKRDGGFPYHWSGRSAARRVRALRDIEARFPRYGPGFWRLAEEVWAELSSESHAFPDWQIVDFGASLSRNLELHTPYRATPEYHDGQVLAVCDMLRSTRQVIHEARTGRGSSL